LVPDPQTGVLFFLVLVVVVLAVRIVVQTLQAPPRPDPAQFTGNQDYPQCFMIVFKFLFPFQTLELREHLYGPSDISIVVKGVKFPVHREVLVEQSEYFR
jgi:hypothetical protein